MDNLTHALTGAGILAFALSTPAAANPETGAALAWGVMLASQVPDFDIAIRLKGNGPYLKHHRGFSHSLLAQLLIPTLLVLLLLPFFPEMSLTSVWLWTYLATLLHIFLDLLTAYGTRVLWPLSPKMLALDILLIIDPFIILATGTATVLWALGRAAPVPTFKLAYLLMGLYIVLRVAIYLNLRAFIDKHFPEKRSFSIIPTWTLFSWNFVVDMGECFLAGTVRWPSRVIVEKKFNCRDRDKVIDAAWKAPAARIFIDFARHMWVDYEETPDGYNVFFSDLRFLFGDKTPFTAKVKLDKDLRVIDEDFGWRRRSAT